MVNNNINRIQGGNSMKYKKLILILTSFILMTVYIVYPYVKETNKLKEGFKEKIIRFHVIANSDYKEDQEMKLKIRDKILGSMGEKFGNSHSKEETREIIYNNLENIKSIAEEEIKKEGKDYTVDVSLGQDTFPTKTYGDVTFPQGEYEALKVVIGEGKGKNWWCVMFPPLCFIDMTHGVTKDTEKELKGVLTEEEYALLLSEKEEPVVLKSKIAEIFEKTKDYLANIK